MTINTTILTADGILKVALPRRSYFHMKNRTAVAQCIKDGICTSCRADKARTGLKTCAGCGLANAARMKQRRA